MKVVVAMVNLVQLLIPGALNTLAKWRQRTVTMTQLDNIKQIVQTVLDSISDLKKFRLMIDDSSTEQWTNGYVFIPHTKWNNENESEPMAGAVVIYCSNAGKIEIVPSYAAAMYEEYLARLGIIK